MTATRTTNVVLRLTRSQQMALIDVLVAYMRSDDVQLFVDVSTDTETTVGELLSAVSSVAEIEVTEDADGTR